MLCMLAQAQVILLSLQLTVLHLIELNHSEVKLSLATISEFNCFISVLL